MHFQQWTREEEDEFGKVTDEGGRIKERKKREKRKRHNHVEEEHVLIK
jgi:hypothetical protein